MRPWILILLSIVLGLVFGAGITVMELGASPVGNVPATFAPRAAPTDKGPRVVVDADEYDFGSMERESQKSHSFVVRNEGHELLVLKKGETTCRCTKFEIVKTDLAPGESTEVKVEWKARDVNPGPFRQSASIDTNDPERPQVSFSIFGNVTYSHKVVPESIVFSSIPVNESRTATARIYSFRPGQLDVTSRQLSDAETADRFEVKVEPMPASDLEAEKDARSGVIVSVTVKPGLPVGAFRQKIQLKLNLTDEPTVELPVEGNIVSDLLLVGRGWDPERGLLTLGTISSSEGFKEEMLILASGSQRSKVRPTVRQVTPEMLKVTVGEPKELDGEQVRVPVMIEIPPGSRPAVHLGGSEGPLGEIILDTGHPEAKTLKLAFALRWASEAKGGSGGRESKQAV